MPWCRETQLRFAVFLCFSTGRAENKAGCVREREIAVWLTWCAQERRSGSLKRGVKARAKRAAGARRDGRQKDKKIEAALSIQKSEETEAPHLRSSQAQVPKG